MWPTLLLVLYCLLIAAASFLGGLLPGWLRLSHTRLQLLMSFVGGLILGVALLHMLPHAMAHHRQVDLPMAAMLTGVLVMFFLMRAFHIHHHEPVEPYAEGAARLESCGHTHGHHGASHGQHGASHGQHGASTSDHKASLADSPASSPEAQSQAATSSAAAAADLEATAAGPADHVPGVPGQVSWLGLATGFSLHTLLDGVALAASVQLAAAQHQQVQLFGFGIFLAILLHKPLDAMSIVWTARASGWASRWIWSTNLLFAMMCPIGALACYFGFDLLGGNDTAWIAVALAFSAGVFVCISLSDILPEVSFHSHDRATLSAALLLGVALAWSISFLEPAHTHGAAPAPVDPALAPQQMAPQQMAARPTEDRQRGQDCFGAKPL